MIIQENHYNSLYFQGGSWIEFPKIENMKMYSSDSVDKIPRDELKQLIKNLI